MRELELKVTAIQQNYSIRSYYGEYDITYEVTMEDYGGDELRIMTKEPPLIGSKWKLSFEEAQ